MLLFDEPLSNLDARLRRQMREEIRDLQQRLGLTVVYVTHDQAEAMAVSDRIIVMNRATIAQEGAPRELYEQPRDAFVAGFMGDANRVRGDARAPRCDGIGDVAPRRRSTLALPHRGLPDGEVDVAIRPEAIALRRGGRRAAARHRAQGGLSRRQRSSTRSTRRSASCSPFPAAVDAPLAVG